MPRIVPIDDPADPRVDLYRNQRDAWLRARHHESASDSATGTGYAGGLFMAEGELVLHHLLASDFAVESVLLTPRRLESLGSALDALPPQTPVFVAEKQVMSAVCGFDIHRGVLAAARRGEPRDPVALARAVRTLVVLENLSNHDNVGSIFRSAAALCGLGSVGVLLSPRCCDPLYRKAIRVSMGLALRVPFAPLDPWPGGLDRLTEIGFETIALTPGHAAEPIDRVEPPERTALLVGGEGPGLSGAALERAARKVRIPIGSGVDSLNASIAAAIGLHRLAPGQPGTSEPG